MKSLQKHACAHRFGGDAGGRKPAIANDGSRLIAMRDADVLIAGAGPTGLMLAGELALAGVDVAIVERRASQDLAGSRAGGLHSRTIEILDQRGIADRFLSEGQKAQVAMFGGTRLDISNFPTRHNRNPERPQAPTSSRPGAGRHQAKSVTDYEPASRQARLASYSGR